MAKDQAHEQSNMILQTKGGAAGLYENHEALMLFMLNVPECTRVVEEFEAIHNPPPSSTGHHAEGRSLQATFRKDISYFVKVVGLLGNTFVATSLELVAFDTQNVMEESVVTSRLKYVKLVRHFTPHTSEKGRKINLFQYSSETTW